MSNGDLQIARANKADEFYTAYEDIEKEVSFYSPEIWENKVLYMPCDDYRESNFYRFFKDNFDKLRLRKIVATCFCEDSSGIKAEFDGKTERVIELIGNGDFSSSECKREMMSCNIVVTNPPFSKFREFIDLINYMNKRFLILGNINAATYKEVFPRIVRREVKIGPSKRSGDLKFRVPDDYPLDGTACSVENGIKFIRVKGVRWFTNLLFEAKITSELSKTLEDVEYQKYDRYADAINVNTIKDVPVDYSGEIGVPISVFDKIDSDGRIRFVDKSSGKLLTFEITGMLNSGNGKNFDFEKPVISGKCKFKRILIKKFSDK